MNLHPPVVRGLVTWFASLSALSGLASAQFSELLAKVPPAANMIVVLDAEDIFASDVATRGNWKQHYDATYADSPLLLPPGAQQFVLAAELELATMKPRWEVAVMRLADDPSMNLIARTIRGERGTVADLETITTPKNALIAKFGPHLFGMMRPTNRQSAARWIREANARSSPDLTPYLSAAANAPDRVGTEIIMAIELADALDPTRVGEAMKKSAVLRDKSLDADKVADVLTSVRGMALGVRVSDRTHGVLKVDFDRDVAVLKDVAKPLLLEALSQAGAEIDEFADWKVDVGPNRISLEGDLTQSGLRRLFSFLELDATAVATPPQDGPTQPADSSNAATSKASLQYFQSVATYLGDLKRERGATTYGSIALWFDKYARRIDRLPILNVDKELVDYGAYVVGRLRNCVEAIKGSGVRSGAESANVYGDYGGYELYSSPGNYAASEVGAVEAERRAIRAGERAASSTDVRGIIREIQEESSKIRRKMTDRYKVEFTDKPSR